MNQPTFDIGQRVKMTETARIKFPNLKSYNGYVKRYANKYRSMIVQRDGLLSEDSVWSVAYWEKE